MTQRLLPIVCLLLLPVGGCSSKSDPDQGNQQSSQAAESQSSLEEDYSYPGAEKIFTEQEIRLLTGDGNMLLAPCDDNSILVFSSQRPEATLRYCFSVRGDGGYVTLELP